MKKRKKIIIFPEKTSENNFYLNNLSNMLSNNYEVYSYKELKRKPIELFNKDIIILNWFENVDNFNFFKNIVKYVMKMLFIFSLKISRTEIIWTIHNNKPHELKNRKLNNMIFKFLAKTSNKIHVLCTETKNKKFLKKYENKIYVAHHGDYIGNYKNSDLDIHSKYNITKNKKIILFIGQVRKYKNIELLINAFNNSQIYDEDFVLLICGDCNSKDYKEKLENKKQSNIYFDFNFIKNMDIRNYLEQSEILVAPYDKDSSLNSGTLWMCLSYAKTMMLPEIGCVKDIKNRSDFLYTYDYNDTQEHYAKLLKCFCQLKDDIDKDKDILQKKGKIGYEYMKNNQTWEKLEDEWIDMIEN